MKATNKNSEQLNWLVQSLSYVELNRRKAIECIEFYMKERDRHEKDAARILREIVELEERIKYGHENDR